MPDAGHARRARISTLRIVRRLRTSFAESASLPHRFLIFDVFCFEVLWLLSSRASMLLIRHLAILSFHAIRKKNTFSCPYIVLRLKYDRV